MKQQDPEFFSDISIVSNPTGTLPNSVVDDASRDSSGIVSGFHSHPTSRVVQVASLGLPSVASPMILDEIDRESNEISPPDGDEVFLGIYESESESKTTPQTLPPSLTSCLPSPLPLTTVEEEKYGKPMGLVSNQGGIKEKFTIQSTLNLNGKYLNTWIVGMEQPREYEKYFTEIKFGIEKKEAAKQVMIPISRPPPPSPLSPPSPPPPPLLPGIDEKNGGTMMESKQSSWEKTTPFNNHLEWGYLGYPSNGLKNDNWAAIDSWGSQLLNRKIDRVLTRKQNINPLVNKATDQRFVNWN